MKLSDFRAQVDVLIADLWKKPTEREYVKATYRTWKAEGTPMVAAIILAKLPPGKSALSVPVASTSDGLNAQNSEPSSARPRASRTATKRP